MLEGKEPQTINWLVMNALVFLGSFLYWNEPKATPTKRFPRSGLASHSQPRHDQSNSQTLQSWAEKNAEPDKQRKKRNEDNYISSICICSTVEHCLSLTWVGYKNFWMQQKKQLQLCLHNWHCLLTFFCFSSEQKQSLPALPGGDRTGRITFLIPAAWNEAGHADARASQAEAQILLQSRTRGWCYFMALWLHLMPEARQQKAAHHHRGKKKKQNQKHFQ